MIFLRRYDTLRAAIEAQYYIRGVHGGIRCICHVTPKASKITVARPSLHGLHHGGDGQPSYGDGQ